MIISFFQKKKHSSLSTRLYEKYLVAVSCCICDVSCQLIR